MELELQIQKLLLNGKGGAEGTAQLLGLSTSSIFRKGNPNDPSQLSLLEFAAILRHTQDAQVIKCLCRIAGGAFVKLPKRMPRVGPATIMQLQDELLGLTKRLVDYNAGSIGSAEAEGAINGTIESLLFIKRQLEAGRELPLEVAQRSFDFDETKRGAK